MPETVDVVLDLRDSRAVPASASDFLQLWAEIEAQVMGGSLRGSHSWQVETPTWGPCGLLLVRPEAAPGLVTGETPFAVRSVLEPSRIIYKCATCLDAGRETYGPFTCNACKDEGVRERVCDRHVVLLDGGFRATCPRHRPQCGTCGLDATFWCGGLNCGGPNRGKKVAHCNRHRRPHPGDQATSYCLDCYAAKFPPCGSGGCVSTGSLACDYVEGGTLKRCGARACSLHAYRWQIFGPHKRGPVLCPAHKRLLSTLSHQGLMFEIVATSVAMRRGPGRLPRLSTTRHIYLNTRDQALRVALLDTVATRLQLSLSDSGFEGRMRRALEESADGRRADVEAERVALREGEAYVGRIQQILAGTGKQELASRISLSDYRTLSRILFVHVPPELIGQFKGKGGENIKSLSRRLGVDVKVETR